MNWTITIYAAILFFVLSPGIFLRFPSKGDKMTVAAVHAVIFALIWHFTHKHVWRFSQMEGFSEGAQSKAVQVKDSAPQVQLKKAAQKPSKK
jgi:hypothetical protein